MARVPCSMRKRKHPLAVKKLNEMKKSSKDPADWVRHTLAFCETYRTVLIQQCYLGRLDLEIGRYMKTWDLTLNRRKRIGTIPGVAVGQLFSSRSELQIVGMHSCPQSGIDTVKDGKALVATSIIMSGGYEDDVDGGEIVEFTGQGGNDYKGSKKQEADQKLERGNAAMRRSQERGYSIRVVRGGSGAYRYDGLYKIYDSKEVLGISNHKIWKFFLRRRPNQPPLEMEKELCKETPSRAVFHVRCAA